MIRCNALFCDFQAREKGKFLFQVWHLRTEGKGLRAPELEETMKAGEGTQVSKLWNVEEGQLIAKTKTKSKSKLIT